MLFFEIQLFINHITWTGISIFGDDKTDNTFFFNQSDFNTSLRFIKKETVVKCLRASDQEISLLMKIVVHNVVSLPLTFTLQSL